MTAFNVMLAKSMPATTETIDQLTGTHLFELKIDGVRGVLAVNKGRATLTNRNGVDITGRYPEIIDAALVKYGDEAQIILDGEVVVMDETGTPSFKLTSKRDRQVKSAVIRQLSESMPATFIAFDILYQDGTDMRRMAYKERKARLEVALLTQKRLPDTDVPTPTIQGNVWSPDGHKLMALVRAHGLEGVVAKRFESIYQAGRRSDWVKIKPTQTVSCVVLGRSKGTGARADTFGALELGLYDDNGNMVGVGEVGSGFKQKDLIEILDLHDYELEHLTDPSIVVEVEFQEFTVDGSLRFPVFRGLRTDQTPADCTLSQVRMLQIQEVPS